MVSRILAVLTCLAPLGCGTAPPPVPAQPEGLGYAEALTIYNQELSLLDRLKSSARDMEAAHEAKLNSLKTSLALGDAVKELQGVNDFAAAQNLLSEEDLAKAKAAGEKAREKLGDAGAKAGAEIENLVKAHVAKMDELKKEIAEQEAKVERAKQLKDDAEKRK